VRLFASVATAHSSAVLAAAATKEMRGTRNSCRLCCSRSKTNNQNANVTAAVGSWLHARVPIDALHAPLGFSAHRLDRTLLAAMWAWFNNYVT
jgi:hypothetical protein